ncbi:MAG: twin-arginine translocation signal domain-containing protein, partial [Rhodovibrionaceae bacterium]
MIKKSSAEITHAAARSFTRRTLLKGAAATGVIAAAAPFILPKSALSSSGEVDVYAWGEYISEDMQKAFEDKTGIKLNLTVFGSNNEVLSKVRAGKGEGYDLVFPSVTTLVAWFDAGEEDGVELLQPIDESRVEVSQLQPAIWEKSLDLGASRRGERYAVP